MQVSMYLVCQRNYYFVYIRLPKSQKKKTSLCGHPPIPDLIKVGKSTTLTGSSFCRAHFLVQTTSGLFLEEMKVNNYS